MVDRYVEAADDCEKALKIDPSLVRLHSRRGRALCKLGHLEPSTEAYNRVIAYVNSSTTDSVKSFANGKTTLSQAANNATATNAENNINREDAKTGLKQVAVARDLLVYVNKLDSKDDLWRKSNYTSKPPASELSKKLDELLLICPQMRRAHALKAKYMVRMGDFEEAKSYVEGVVLTTDQSILRLHAHVSATYPVPLTKELAWRCNPDAVGSKVTIDSKILVNFFMLLGNTTSLSEWYLNALKNMKICRSYATDVINVLARVLDTLFTSSNMTNSKVDWIVREHDKSSLFITLKTQADKLFRAGNYSEAIRLYTDLLKVDKDAVKWNAVIHGNRAAAQMGLKCYSEAATDCNKAIELDAFYSRAYLRRARAHKAQFHYAAAIRDYRRYLASDPVPTDSAEVQKEMEDTGIARDSKMKDTQQQQQAVQQHLPTSSDLPYYGEKPIPIQQKENRK